MPSPVPQSNQADPKNLADARQMQRAIACAVKQLELVRCRLLCRLEQFEEGEPPVIDGEVAMEFGEPLDLVRWLRERVERICCSEALAEAMKQLSTEAATNPLEGFGLHLREDYRTN